LLLSLDVDHHIDDNKPYMGISHTALWKTVMISTEIVQWYNYRPSNYDQQTIYNGVWWQNKEGVSERYDSLVQYQCAVAPGKKITSIVKKNNMSLIGEKIGILLWKDK
jgi:hypothetical protein